MDYLLRRNHVLDRDLDLPVEKALWGDGIQILSNAAD